MRNSAVFGSDCVFDYLSSASLRIHAFLQIIHVPSEGRSVKDANGKIDRCPCGYVRHLGRRHAHTAQQLKNLYCAEYVHGIYKTSSDLSFRMAAEKSVTVAKQSLRASLRSELSGENRSGEGAPVKIKGLDDDEEEHEHSWGR